MTMTIKIEILGKHLRALMAVAPKNDTRYYLNGVCLDFDKGLIVATDGHRLITVPLSFDQVPAGTKGQLLYSLPAKAPAKTETVDLEIDGDRCIYSYYRKDDLTGQFIGNVIDGRYPNYESVIPENKASSTESVSFNPLLLADIVKALDCKAINMNLSKDGMGSMLIKFAGSPEVTGVLMPCRWKAQ